MLQVGREKWAILGAQGGPGPGAATGYTLFLADNAPNAGHPFLVNHKVVGWQALSLGLLLLLLGVAVALPSRAEPAAVPLLALSATDSNDLVGRAWLAEAGADEAFPGDNTDLAAWFARHPPATTISLQGGHYWLLARVRHDDPLSSASSAWVFDPNNSLIEHTELLLSGSDGSVQRAVSGYREPRAYSLHYGQRVVLRPGVEYQALVRVDSRYFASTPRFEFGAEGAYQRKVLRENLVVVGSLGAMVALALFNLFLFLLTRTPSHLYYALQLGLSVWAWAMVFQIPTELLGWHGLPVHYVPFFLLPAASCLFCIDFLGLKQRHPRLRRWHHGVIAASVLLAPVAVFALPWANLVASVLISAWLALMLVSGFISLRAGYRPARFFVLAFSALALPALIILPGNLDLIPDLVDNAEVLTLLGSAVEALLQAFALADRIRLLGQEKDHVATQLTQTLQVAHTDAMTGLGNRYAFDLMLARRGAGAMRPDAEPYALAVIDLDGLKQVNDRLGHARGDELIRLVGRGLGRLHAEHTRCYRLGGDEFAVLAPRPHEAQLAQHLLAMEGELLANGFEQAGISHGVAHWEPGADPAALLHQADRNMYLNKARRKEARRLQAAGDSADHLPA